MVWLCQEVVSFTSVAVLMGSLAVWVTSLV